eukprot:8389907-Alexandrium_andersonii.AAC.1
MQAQVGGIATDSGPLPPRLPRYSQIQSGVREAGAQASAAPIQAGPSAAPMPARQPQLRIN